MFWQSSLREKIARVQGKMCNFINRIKNLVEVISGFQKEDNVNTTWLLFLGAVIDGREYCTAVIVDELIQEMSLESNLPVEDGSMMRTYQ